MNRAAFILLVFSSVPLAQTGPPGRLKVWYGDGTEIEIHTESTGTNLPLSISGTATVTAGFDYHRLVLPNDRKEARVILGYDIETRKSGQGTYLLRIKPVDTTKFGIGGRGKWLEIPTIAGVREFPPLRMGDAVEVDILYHPVTGERIYDVVRVSGDRPPARTSLPPSPERFSLLAPRVVVNGKTIREPREIWMTGGALAVDMPGRGRFYFALFPSPNLAFRAAGWIDHSALRFHAGSELVEIFAKRHVLEKTEFATIWVYHEPDSGPRAAELARLRRKLEAVRKNYTANHPDVKALEARLTATGQPVEFACGDDAESLTRVKGKWD